MVLSGYKMEQIDVGSTYLGAHNLNEYGTQRVTINATMISQFHIVHQEQFKEKQRLTA